MFVSKRHHNETLAAARDETRVLERRLRTAELALEAAELRLAPFERVRGKGGRFVAKEVSNAK